MATATVEAPVPTRRRIGNIALWVLQALLAALFVWSGVAKLFAVTGTVEGFDKIGWGQWFRYFIGAAELAGGIGLLIPRFTSAAAAGLAVIMVGAVYMHVTALPPASNALTPAVLVIVLAFIAWRRRPR
jgi:uncharacterized membrane protein YphA (DoxX/SURF4 family)